MTQLEVLKMFCNPHQEMFSEPWEIDGFCFATTSKIAARIPAPVPGVTAPTRKVPNMDRIFRDFPRPFSIPLGDAQTAREITCGACDGTGELTCKQCRGSGDRYCPDCGSDHQCGCCEGSGIFPCSCHGGKTWDYSHITDKKLLILSPDILMVLKALPDAASVEFAESAEIPALVRFSGGTAIAMRVVLK